MKTFKIIGTGKGTGIIYKSLKDAKETITKNKIEPLIDTLCVEIEETTVKIHKVHVVVPSLSLENKKFLIDYTKRNLTEKNIEGNTKNIVWLFKYPNNTYLENLLKKWAIDEYKISEDELQFINKTDKIYETDVFKRTNVININKKGYVHCIKQLFEMIEPEKFEFTYNSTNYKPCHNILIELPYKKDGFFNLQIRKNDFPYNEGTCYGRNTCTIKSFKLHDENFEKYCKELDIK